MQWLVDLIIYLRDALKPFEVIDHYDRGVRLRLGKPMRDNPHKKWKQKLKFAFRGDPNEKIKIYEPGFYWKIPFADDFNTHMVKITTMDLSEQTITTKDNISIVARGILKYEVENVATLLLEVDDPAAAVVDMSMGILREVLMEKNWSECNDPKLGKEVARRIRVEAKKWGIKVEEFTLTDLAQMRSIRLLGTKF